MYVNIGEKPFDDIYDFINRRIEELMDTDDFKKIADEYSYKNSMNKGDSLNG